jgi:acyl carrier protein
MSETAPAIADTLRDILRAQNSIPFNVDRLTEDSDLYAAGLTSLMSVDVMLAVEQRFGIMFPDEVLTRRTFSSIGALRGVVAGLLSGAAC